MMRMYEEVAAASEGEIRTRMGGNAGPAESDVWPDVRMPESMPPMEWRRGLVLEPAGTLTMTRKMAVLVRARQR